MSGNGKNSEEKQPEQVDAPRKAIAESMFSEEEIRATVKAFVLSWLSGEVKISFPLAAEILERSRKAGKLANYTEALDREVAIKTDFTNLILICSGAKKSSPQKQRLAMIDLFDNILSFRSSDRIKGRFLAFSMSKKMEKLEQDLKVTNDLVEQLVALHKQELGI